MATTDTRSGFRLPWSSDRTPDDPQPEPVADAVEASSGDAVDPNVTPAARAADQIPTEAADAMAADPTATAGPDGANAPDVVGTSPDAQVDPLVNQVDPSPDPDDRLISPAKTPEEPQAMAQTISAPAPAAARAPRKPSKLLADLAAAMRATAETAREQALAQVSADSQQVVETIRARSTEGTADLRQQSDSDIAGIRDWSKAEIARIREQAEQRIAGRKTTLEAEITAYAAAVDRRIEDVQRVIAQYEADMADFFERLLGEDDPARLATMAETMPEPPTLETLADLDTLEVGALAAAEPDAAVGVEAVAEPEVEPEAVATGEPAVEAAAEPEAVAQGEETAGPAAATAEIAAGAVTDAQDGGWGAARSDPRSTEDGGWGAARSDPWSTEDGDWGAASPAATLDGEAAAAADASDTASPDVPTWATELPEGVATVDESGEPIDRETIMAALEAAAEALVAAEAAGDGSAQTADGQDPGSGDDDQFGAEAAAALAARMDAASLEREASFVERMSHLLPGRGGAAPDVETATTQVMVTGLVSVASIASFKRHLSRMIGVQTVTVSSGPDGEFVFNVTHLPELSFNDAIPTMPGFAARVTGGGDGIVNVTARDPETEG